MSTTNAITTLYKLDTEKKGNRFINIITVDLLTNKFNYKKELFSLNQQQGRELTIHEYKNNVNRAIEKNNLFYFTFVGTQKDNPHFPEYYYDTFSGKDICFEINDCKGDTSFTFKIRSESSLYTAMNLLFANDNVGVIIQNY